MKKNVISDAVELAQQIEDYLKISDQNVVNIFIGNEDERLEISDKYQSIARIFIYNHEDTPKLLEKYQVIEGITNKWWYEKPVWIKGHWGQNRPDSLAYDDGITGIAQNNGYFPNDRVAKYYYVFSTGDTGPERPGQMAILINKTNLKKFIDSISKSVLVDAPIDRKYWYDNRKLQFRLVDGSIDSFDFSKAEISRKLFEAFYELWRADGSGEYLITEVAQIYKKLHHEDLIVGRIGEIVSNIRHSIINPKTSISKGIEWRSNGKGSRWIFKIHPLI